MSEAANMVEKVARAIFKEFRPHGHFDHHLWQEERDDSFDAARAAIEAMAEPTECEADHPSYVDGEWSRRNVRAYANACLGEEG